MGPKYIHQQSTGSNGPGIDTKFKVKKKPGVLLAGFGVYQITGMRGLVSNWNFQPDTKDEPGTGWIFYPNPTLPEFYTLKIRFDPTFYTLKIIFDPTQPDPSPTRRAPTQILYTTNPTW